jgi:hypothetical protein
MTITASNFENSLSFRYLMLVQAAAGDSQATNRHAYGFQRKHPFKYLIVDAEARKQQETRDKTRSSLDKPTDPVG